jgi:hypothetical protein
MASAGMKKQDWKVVAKPSYRLLLAIFIWAHSQILAFQMRSGWYGCGQYWHVIVSFYFYFCLSIKNASFLYDGFIFLSICLFWQLRQLIV